MMYNSCGMGNNELWNRSLYQKINKAVFLRDLNAEGIVSSWHCKAGCAD